MELGLRGKVAFITGAGSGLGEATARVLAAEGTHVALVGRTADELQAVQRDIDLAGGQAVSLVADISEPEAMERVAQQAYERWGRLDYVFANAGINGTWARLEELTVDDFDQTVKVNLRGTFITLKVTVPYLKRTGGGSIVVTSSVNGTRIFTNTGATAYSTTKAGQVAMTKMLALELADDKIRVNVICPGAIESNIDQNTEQRGDPKGERPAVEFPEGEIPLTGGKPGKAKQVGELVAFLFSDASSHVAGTEVWIDGAQSLLQG